MTSGLYKINLANNRFYIGSSVDLDNRHRQHYQDLVRKQHKNDIMQKSFNKHGVFEFKAIMHCNESDLLFYEQAMLDDSFDKELCVNLSPSAGTVRGLKHPIKTHCMRGHEYNEENTHVDKKNKRHCRACARLRENPMNNLSNKNKTHCPKGHEYTPYVPGNKRICIQCQKPIKGLVSMKEK